MGGIEGYNFVTLESVTLYSRKTKLSFVILRKREEIKGFFPLKRTNFLLEL